jgi:hypothetical protein
MVTVNDVRDGLIAKLVQLFPGSKVTGEEIKQGLGQGRFFVKLLTASQTGEIGRRSRRAHSLDVRYFGKSNEEMHDVAEALYAGLKLITLPSGDTVRGTSMRHEIVDEVLHFFVDFNIHVLQAKEPETKMGSLSTGVKVKDG